ncbi:TetR family transcriptional regulator [Escherichia coli]|nr:TetR family transcriptional regulator [Escherichia coli]
MVSGLVNGGDYFYNNLSFTVTRYNGIMATDSTQCVKKSRGRPKVFDRDAALDKAMKLFWQHGYEATSLADLVEATGAKAPTLYAEFTNKEGYSAPYSTTISIVLPPSMKHSCFVKRKAWSLRWLTILLPSPTALPAKTLRLAAS